MRLPLSWLREHVDLPADLTADGLEKALVKVGLEVEELTDQGATVDGPLVVGRVESIEELTGLKKPIRFYDIADLPERIVRISENLAEEEARD